MTSDEHVLYLGKLLGNLHALEMSLRAFLMNRPGARPVHHIHGADVLGLPVGSDLPDSDLTSRAYLSELVRQFNEIAASESTPLIDENVIEVRNTLAHGCVFGAAAAFPVHILKFSKPSSGKVQILANEAMTREWFERQHKAVVAALMVVAARNAPQRKV
jgi:hypothetical protein